MIRKINYNLFTVLLFLITANAISFGDGKGACPISGTTSSAELAQSICAMAAIHYSLNDIPESDIIKMFNQAENDGDPCGTMWLARLYFKGRCSLPKRTDQAIEMASSCMEKVLSLAENGHREAQFLMGSAYQEGLAIERDFTKAIKWYELASVSGHLTATNNLGYMLAWGRGTDPNIEKARRLFKISAEKGAKTSANNLKRYRDDGRDDKERLASLRKVSLVQVLGMQKEQGFNFLIKKGLLSNKKYTRTKPYGSGFKYYFPTDGIVIGFDINNRIVIVEGHAQGSSDSTQYRGKIPFGLNWNDSKSSTSKILGRPDDSGFVRSDNAKGMAYRIENVFFSIMFSYDGDKKVKLWRVYEKWAEKYPDLN
ncbi:MAG: sel1 repeat family protein [Planctomycetes bacterium]|nr:sel1 repeat family protein [Planctomycetota bacterium]